MENGTGLISISHLFIDKITYLDKEFPECKRVITFSFALRNTPFSLKGKKP